MIRFKACGRCHGDVRFDPDRHGVDIYCLQCGARTRLTSAEIQALGKPALASAAPSQREPAAA